MLTFLRRVVQPLHRHHGSVAWIVLLAGLVLTAVAWRDARAREDEHARAVFDRWVEETHASIDDRMSDYEQVLRGASGLFAASEGVSRSEWRGYCASLEIDRYFPGIERLGIVRRVAARDLDAHERTTRAEGLQDYAVTPTGQRDEYFPIVNVYPESTNGLRSLGHDVDSDPWLRSAMQQARDSGEPTLTALVTITPTRDSTFAGVVLYYPVYSTSMPHDTVDARRKSLVGFVHGVFRMRHLMTGIVKNRPPGIDFDVYDGPVTAATLLYDDDNVLKGSESERPRFSTEVSLEMGGRLWTMEMSTLPAFNASIDRTADRVLLAGGIVVSVLLFAMVHLSERWRRRETTADKQKLAALVENSGEYIGLATLDGVSTYLNRGGMALIGAEHERDVVGKPFVELLHEDAARAIIDSSAAVAATGTWHGDIMLRHQKTGLPIPCEMTAFVVRRPGTGEPLSLACVAHDITERLQAEAALRESEERFRQMAEGTQEAFWLFAIDSNDFLYISPAFEAIWGRTRASVYAAPGDWLDAIHPEDRPRFGPASIESRLTGPSDEQYRIIRPGGEVRFIRERAAPIRDGAGRVYRVAAIAEDVTDRRRLELELRQAQKMEAMGTLAGGIAHDFNNILGAIVGYAELATMDADGNQRVLKSLAAVKTASQRATDLVRQILAFSRKDDQQRQSIHLAPVLDDALTLLRASLPSSIEIRAHVGADTPAVLADATQIHQVIMNLGINAWHAMKDGVGTLEVTLRPFGVDHDFAHTRIELKPGLHALLSIRDTGCGMDRATQARIFDPFFTTKAPGQGTGLGLSTVHGIVKSYEGAIAVYSQPGEGTTFHVYLPASHGVAAAAGVGVEAVPRGDGQRILFVDDEAPLAHWGEEALQRLGYRVTPYTDGMEALAAVMNAPDSFDLVVTDLTMPGITGLKLAQELTAVRPNLPVILTTGYSAALTSESARQFGVSELLLKPMTLQALGETVHRVLMEKEGADTYDSHLVGG